jgi:hypothetical protein
MPGETVSLCQLDLPLVGFIQDGSALAIAPEAPSQSGNRTLLCLFRCHADHIFIVGLWVRVGIVADFIWVHRHYINRVHELDQVFRQPGRT